MRPLIVVSDVHLGHRPCDDVARDLARLVAAHPEHEIVLNGDSFNLSCDPPDGDPGACLASVVAAHPELKAALGAHLAAERPVTLIPGNHDAALAGPGIRAALLAALDQNDAPLAIEPWFIRRGDVHIEHGHLYDSPNSPSHPLVPPSPTTEPVGIAITRRFVGPWDVWDTFANQWTGTAVEKFAMTVGRLGWRAGIAIADYWGILAVITVEVAGRGRLYRRERAEGDAALAAFAAHRGVPAAALRGVLDNRPQPLHESARATFLRFGFDAVLALAAMPIGVVLAFTVSVRWGAAVAILGLGYLVAARNNLAARGVNHMSDELRDGAALVSRMTDARLVIFGHTHLEDESQGYLNLGAFGDRPNPARTFVHVDEQGRAERRQLPVAER
jgi:UDP-2,3-diacylglucosamine pyrophosphatase LpxH